MLIGMLAVIVAVIGALIYALATQPKIAELGRLTYHAAMIGLMVAFAAKVIKLLG
jgi:hypothetical protein